MKTLDIYIISCYYNTRGGDKMYHGKRETKKPTKSSTDWRQTLIGAMVDLIVGTVLILIAKLFE